jgi:hypothetical protein
MPRRPLSPFWSLEIDESFVSQVVEGDLQMVSPGPPVRTVWAALFAPPLQMSPAEILGEAGEYPPTAEVETFQHETDEELRLAHWYQEEADGRGVRPWALYGYAARRGELVTLSFLSDSEADKRWALKAWDSLRFQPEAHPESL